jgi:hypothetical protein
MAKKNRRVKKRDVRLSSAQLVRPSRSEAAVAPGSTGESGGPASLREEYRYVIADLKRIGLIALGMVALLIALAFLLT